MARSNIKYTKQHRVLANEFIEVSSGFVTTNLPFTADTNYKVKVASITEGGSNISYNKSSGAFSCNEIWEGLPSGYTQLEYIQSNGSQWIDTGVVINLNSSGDGFDILTQATTASQNGMIIGEWVTSKYFWLYHYNSGGCIRMYFTDSSGSQRYYHLGSSSNTAITRYEYKNFKMYVNGGSAINNDSGTTSFYTSTNTAHLFHANGRNDYGYSGKLYYCKLYKDGALVRYFIPAKNSSNTVGLFDCCTATFYGPSNGTFTAGPAY